MDDYAGHRGTVADPDYCPNCGIELGDPGVFCSACGTRCRPDPGERSATPGDGAPSGGEFRGAGAGRGPAAPDDEDDDYAESARAFRRRIEDWEVDGWEVESYRGDSAVLVGRSYGSWGAHALVFLLTGWFTLGLGNLVYGIYRHQSDPDRVVLRRGGPTAGASRRRRSGSTGNALLGLAVFLLGVALLVPFPPDATGALLAAFLFAVGAVVFPPTRRRIDDRHPVSTFGRVRSTEERVVRDPTLPCTACSAPVENGVERRFREEFVVAGFPLATTDEGANHYCRDCAPGPSDLDDGVEGDAIDAELAAIADEGSHAEAATGADVGDPADGESPDAESAGPDEAETPDPDEAPATDREVERSRE